MSQVDLHIHTNYSDDADLSPEEIISQAKEKELRAIAITDHNTTEAIEETQQLTAGMDLEIIPGIEIDTNYGDNTLHILGYYMDLKSDRINQLLAGIEEAKQEQFEKRIERLQELGFAITAQEVKEKSDVDRPLGGFIAKVLLSKAENKSDHRLQTYLTGDKSDQPYFNFYLDYFRPGGKAYVSCWKPATKDAVKTIRKLGGVAVLAHPGSTLNIDDEEVIIDLKQAGLQGIEAYSTYHNAQETKGFKKLAEKYDLLMTAGSDFHGELKPKIELGGVEENKYQIVEQLKQLRGGKYE